MQPPPKLVPFVDRFCCCNYSHFEPEPISESPSNLHLLWLRTPQTIQAPYPASIPASYQMSQMAYAAPVAAPRVIKEVADKDRRSRMAYSTYHQEPKKGGAGGAYTWGTAGDVFLVRMLGRRFQYVPVAACSSYVLQHFKLSLRCLYVVYMFRIQLQWQEDSSMLELRQDYDPTTVQAIESKVTTTPTPVSQTVAAATPFTGNISSAQQFPSLGSSGQPQPSSPWAAAPASIKEIGR